MQRRYDLDWLRIAAFGVLILYHIGMVFVPWDFHIKTAVPVEWLEPVMLLPNAWRLSLLFVISGVASRAMLGRTRNGFAGARTRRLLVPLLAGMALWVAPQAWVDVTVNHGYTESFGHFWRSDYFRFDKSLGVMVPTWNHLWFVAYLWVYSVVLAVLMLLPAPVRARAQRGFDRLFGGWRLLALPVLFLWTVRLALIDRFPETHALVDDWSMHLTYGAAFIFGVGLGPGGLLWAGIARWWKLAGIAALLAWAGVALTYIVPGADIVAAGPVVAARLARAIQAWGSIIGLLGLAQVYWQHDHRWRATLVEAVFPAYIIHQTVLIVVMFWIRPFGWPPLLEFGVLLVAVMAGCALFYRGGRAVAALRPLIGLGDRRKTADGVPIAR